MKLIDLLVKELPKRGGWPEEAKIMSQDAAGMINAHRNERLVFLIDKFWTGTSKNDACKNFSPFYLKKATDWNTNTVTRDQYEAALAASEGWIEWAGGECPVDSDAIVEVKYRIPRPYQYNNYNDRAGDFDWEHIGSNADIIAYRLHQPTKSEQVRADAWRAYAGMTEKDEEDDLNDCIGRDVGMPEWNGEGLPPVGCECEVKRAVDWVKCKILFISDAHVVLMADEECCWNTCACQFRPLRTEAERTRESAAKEMDRHANSDQHRKFNAGLRNCLSIYDAIAAGKIPGVKLEGK